MQIEPAPISAITASKPRKADPLFVQAQALEASFLSEMLGNAGLGAAEGAFSGGSGEEQFSSFLRQEQARLIVGRGGIGLAEAIYESLKQRG